MKSILQTSAVALGLLATSASALQIQITDENSIKKAASTVAYGLLKYYTGNNTGDTPGNLPDPYYWWEAGGMFGTLLDYSYYTGDHSYDAEIMQAMVHQTGDNLDYMPENQTRTEGNDDQGFWAMAAMTAAENKFKDPPKGISWLGLTQAVFEEYKSRWESNLCGGGMRWQIYNFNKGWSYKNMVANGCFMNIAARIGRYLNNDTYVDWAEKIWDWGDKIGLIGHAGGTIQILDGIQVHEDSQTCSVIDKTQWSYNQGIWLHSAATLYNMTKSDKWKQRTDAILKNSMKVFTNNSIIFEQYCESWKQCNTDQMSFKGYYIRSLSKTMLLAPHTADIILPYIKKSAPAVATACAGSPTGPPPPNTGPPFTGVPGTACSFTWLGGAAYDGLAGVGAQMNALSGLMYTLTRPVVAPITSKTGGTSKSVANAGNPNSNSLPKAKPLTLGDRIGAGILTALMIASIILFLAFMINEETHETQVKFWSKYLSKD